MEIITKVMPIIDPFIGQTDMKIIKHFTISQHTHTHTHMSSMYILLISYAIEVITKLMPTIDASVGQQI